MSEKEAMDARHEALGLALPDAAKAAGVSAATLNRAIRRGILKAKKLGSRSIVLRADLEAFLNDLPSVKRDVAA